MSKGIIWSSIGGENDGQGEKNTSKSHKIPLSTSNIILTFLYSFSSPVELNGLIFTKYKPKQV